MSLNTPTKVAISELSRVLKSLAMPDCPMFSLRICMNASHMTAGDRMAGHIEPVLQRGILGRIPADGPDK